MLTVKGPKEIWQRVPPHVSINITGEEAVVERANGGRDCSAHARVDA